MVEIVVYKKCSFLLGFLKTSVELTPCVRHGRWEGNTISDLIKLTAFLRGGRIVWQVKDGKMAMILGEKDHVKRGTRETMEA